MCLQIRPGCSHDGSRHQGVPQNTRDNIYNSGDSRCLRSAQCQCSRGTNYLIQIYAMVWFSKCQRWCRFPRPRHRARVCTPTSRSWSTPASTTPASTSTGTTGWSSGTVLYCTVLYRTVLYCGDQGRHQHQEGGAHQHQLQRPHVGHRQQAAAPRSVANKYHEYNVDSRLTILSTI